MASPYRFSDPEQDGAQMRSRVGLAGVTSGASSGGEGYRASALRPGSGGYAAASFGAAPRTDYVKPAAATEEAPAAPPLAPAAPPAAVDNSWEAGRGGAGIEGGGPDANGMEAGVPGEMGDLGIDFDGKTVGGVIGAGLGLLSGIPGASILGGLAGRALGSTFGAPAAPQPTAQVTAQPTAPGVPGSGDGGMADGLGPTGNEQMGHDANAAAGNENASAGPSAEIADAGFAEGGRVTGDRLRGLGQVSGNDTDYQDARVTAAGQWRSLPVGYSEPRLGRLASDPVLNRNNADAAIETMSAERYPGVSSPSPGVIEQLIMSRPDLRQAIIDQIGSVHPVNPGAPSTGNMPGYQDGGPVDALAGPNPPGPDDGFAALDQGEFVVRQSQAQRPEYASVLDQINQGTYQPGQDDSMGGGEPMMTDGQMPAEGRSPESDPAALPPIMQEALANAMASDPLIAAAMQTLLGPAAVTELSSLGAGSAASDPMAGAGPTGRPPLAGPRPVPGMHAPPGVRPPAAATPTMPFPPPPMPADDYRLNSAVAGRPLPNPPVGLRGVAA